MGINGIPSRKLVACMLICSGGVAPSHATTLTFDFTPTEYDCGGNGCIPPDYGSRIGDTPNVAVSYSVLAPGAPRFSVWNSGYGELLKALGHGSFNVPGEIVLTPDPGYGVRLRGFQIAGWFSPYQTDIAIYDSNGTRANPNLFEFSGLVPGAASISPLTSPVVSFGEIRIYVSNIGSTGIDNLSFEQLPADIAMTLSKSDVAGCKSVTARVTLPSPAPAGGLILSVSDTLAAAMPPATVKIAEGATSKSFIIKTAPVGSNQSGTVTATLGGASASQPLTLRPMGLLSVTLKPTTVAGSQPVNGTAKLECAAGPGPITVDLSSSVPSAAYPVATIIAIPQGLQSQEFTVATNAVLAKASAMITGEVNGTTKTRKLNVTPAAEISPRSLKFGNVAVGMTSGALTTTLTNKGAAAFFVDSIGIAGSYASWFSQTNNCPSSLPAGGSCTISVKFKPAFAATKSAKLTITTNATSTPLSVSLSGTGF